MEVGGKGRGKGFVKPSMDEMIEFAGEIGLPEKEAKKAWFYYESKGWKVGSAGMKNWRASLRGWRMRWQDDQAKNGNNRYAVPNI